jgi:heat-inducible transcriptional repressor
MHHSPAPPLTERQVQVLLAVVEQHVASKQPVGSKQLRQRYGFSVSSATLRNEMAFLEEAGYLYHPHTSAGRVPTAEGFRLYVNRVREQPLPEHREASRVYESECRRLEGRPRALMRATSRSLCALTGYPSIVMTPSRSKDRFKTIAVYPVSTHNLRLSYETDTGKRIEKLLRSPEPLRADQIALLSRALAKIYTGKIVGELSAVTGTDLAAAVADIDLPEGLLFELRRAVESEEERDIYVDGTSYILDEPQFQEVASLRAFIETLDQHWLLRETLLPAADAERVTVIIGGENRVHGMAQCSVVAQAYARTGTCAGSVAVLGPMCMDYVNAMAIVSLIANRLGEAVTKEDLYT